MNYTDFGYTEYDLDNYTVYIVENGTLVPYERYTDGDLKIIEE